MSYRSLLVILLVPLCAGTASAGIHFGKKTIKPTPAERVPELIKVLKSDGDEGKRSAAADELRQYDPKEFPDIIPALIDALLNDKKPAVRSEAAASLSKLRPINAAAGAALEQALAKDNSMRVRLQARSSLLTYRWAGYSSKVKDEPLTQSKEPPLADETTPASTPPSAANNLPRLVPVPAPTETKPTATVTRKVKETKPKPATPDDGPELTPP